MAAAAAKEIKTLIGASVEKVDAGAKLVDQAGATMQEIVESVRRVTDIMGEITAASQEQTSGIEQINQAMNRMDEGTQQNASLVEEAAAAVGLLEDQAAKLSRVVSVFKLGALHAPAQSAPAPKARAPHCVNKAAARAPARPKIAFNARAAADQEWEQF